MVIVDDHAMFRSGVKYDIGARIELVGEGEDVPTAVRAILATLPDVVLLDVHLPGGGGAEVIKQVTATQPGVKFLALSASDAAEDVIGVIRAGARGCVTKSILAEELVAAIGRVATGDAVFSPRLAGFVLDAFSGAIDVASIDEDLDRLGARARGPAPDRPRLRLQGSRQGALHLDQDRRDPCLRCCASCSSRIAISSPGGPPTASWLAAVVPRACPGLSVRALRLVWI